MERGYVRLYRKKLDSDIWQYPNADRVFEFLMLSATYRPHKYFAYGTCIDLLPGQYISSLRVMAWKCRLSLRALRTSLTYLKSTQRIAQQTTHQYSVFTILNWDCYQNSSSPTDTPIDTLTDTGATQERHSDDTGATQKQEVKNLRSKEKPKTHTPSAAETAAIQIVDYYENEIRKDQSSRYRARKNAESLLKNGCTKEVLWECVNLYASDADHKDPQFRKVAANFFGRDAVFRNYMDEAKRIVEVEYAKEG
jgi:hypothetical protein